MIKLDQNFAEFLKLLNSHGVEYLVIGGYAVSLDDFDPMHLPGCLMA